MQEGAPASHVGLLPGLRRRRRSVVATNATVRFDVVGSRRTRIVGPVRIRGGRWQGRRCYYRWWYKRWWYKRWWWRRPSSDPQRSACSLVAVSTRDHREAVHANAQFESDAEAPTANVRLSPADGDARTARHDSSDKYVVARDGSRRTPHREHHLGHRLRRPRRCRRLRRGRCGHCTLGLSRAVASAAASNEHHGGRSTQQCPLERQTHVLACRSDGATHACDHMLRSSRHTSAAIAISLPAPVCGGWSGGVRCLRHAGGSAARGHPAAGARSRRPILLLEVSVSLRRCGGTRSGETGWGVAGRALCGTGRSRELADAHVV